MAERRKRQSLGGSAAPVTPDLSPHILDSMLDAVVVANPDGRVRMMNRAALELLGYTAIEVAGQPVGKFFEEEEEEEEEEATFFRGTGLARLVREGSAREIETTLVTRAGDRVPAVFNGSLVRNAGGQLLAVVGVARDMRPTRRLIREAEARAAEAHVLKTVAEALNRAVGLQEALDRSLDTVMALIGSEAGWIVLLEESENTRLAAAHNLPPALEADDHAAMLGGCQCLDLLRRGHLQAAANIIECERLRTARGDTRGLRHHASVFLRAGARPLGNLNLTTPAGRTFTDSELNLLTAVGDQIGVAIERARLHEQVKAHRIEEQAALLKLSRALLGETEAQAVMDRAIAVVAEVFRPDLCKILLLDDGGRLVLRAGQGWPSGVVGQATVPSGVDSQAGYTLMVRGPVAVEDFARETRFRPPPLLVDHGVAAGMSAPMLAGERAIGVLGVHWRSPRRFNDDEVRLLVLIANSTAEALDRARLSAETQQRAEELATLNQASRVIISSLNIQEVLASIVAMAGQVLNSAYTSVVLAREDGSLDISAENLHGMPPLEARARPAGTTRRILATGEPLIFDQVTDNGTHNPSLAEAGIKSYAGVPLIVKGHSLGVLFVHSTRPRAFSGKLPLLTIFANQAAVAIENARLFQAEREQRELAEALRDAATALSATLDFDTVLDRLLEQIARVAPYDAANVMLVDPPVPPVNGRSEGARIRIARQRGYEQFGERVVRDIAALSLEIAATPNLRQMAETGLPLIIFDTAAYPGWVKVEASAHVRSWAGAPIVVEGQTIAFFSLDRVEPNFYRPEHGERLAAFAGQAALALQNARLFESLAAEKRRLELLHHLGQALAASLDPREVAVRALDLTTAGLGIFKGEVLVLEPGSDRLRLVAVTGHDAESVEQLDRQIHLRVGQGLAGHTALRRTLAIVSDVSRDEHWQPVPGLDDWVQSAASIPLIAGDELVGVLSLLSDHADFFGEHDRPILSAVATPVALALQNARLFDETRRRADELEALAEVSSALRQAPSLEAMRPIILEATLRVMGAQAGTFFLLDAQAEELYVAAASGYPMDVSQLRLKVGQGLAGECARSRQPILVDDISTDPRIVMREAFRNLHKALCFPLQTSEALTGVLLVSFAARGYPTSSEANLLVTIAEVAANALHRAALHEQTVQRLQRLNALHAIDMAISSSVDVRLTLNILLNQITTHLRVDAADVLLLNPHTQTLEYAAGRGFRTPALQSTRLRLGQGYAGRAALDRRIVTIPDLRQRRTDFLRSPLFAQEAFITVYAIPLIAKGQVVGVLEIFHRAPLAPDPEWLEFLEALGVQAAIAIDNAGLFDGLQRANTELAVAYDSTLEGWARALELRDKETEGHTQRVAEMTVRLARAMGISDSELVHVRRGALLHDIGKMGIPDSILLKPGPLTADEWAIMRQHPGYAYEMLSSIAYLRPALDIPYCHHERWDGSGYPRGLKGEQVPLAARIFAVVDVWDALCSDRPYRRAMPPTDALAYLREQSGKLFDPQIVDKFCRMVP